MQIGDILGWRNYSVRYYAFIIAHIMSQHNESTLISINLKKNSFKKSRIRNSLALQWLGLCAFTAEGPGSIPGWGTKIPLARQLGQKKI